MTTMNINIDDFRKFISAEGSLRLDNALHGATMQIANEWMAKAAARTPVVSSQMRMNWHVEDKGQSGDTHEARVYNSAVGEKGAPYPIYVEFGHRQQVGRFVPKLGKRLVKPWVNGQFMLTNSREEMVNRVPKIIEAHIKRAWEEL